MNPDKSKEELGEMEEVDGSKLSNSVVSLR